MHVWIFMHTTCNLTRVSIPPEVMHLYICSTFPLLSICYAVIHRDSNTAIASFNVLPGVERSQRPPSTECLPAYKKGTAFAVNLGETQLGKTEWNMVAAAVS